METNNFDDNNINITSELPEEHAQEVFQNFHTLLKSRKPLDEIGEIILEGGMIIDNNIQRKDTLDRFIDFIFFQAKTGIPYIPSLAYPCKKIADPDMEEIIIELLNEHLFPEISLSIWKFFTRNVQDPDTNLYLANLIRNDSLIKAAYETFLRFKDDIEIEDPVEKTKYVKMLQQYSSQRDDRYSSPLDAACRFKYILEYLLLITKKTHLYSLDDLKLTDIDKIKTIEQISGA